MTIFLIFYFTHQSIKLSLHYHTNKRRLHTSRLHLIQSSLFNGSYYLKRGVKWRLRATITPHRIIYCTVKSQLADVTCIVNLPKTLLARFSCPLQCRIVIFSLSEETSVFMFKNFHKWLCKLYCRHFFIYSIELNTLFTFWSYYIYLLYFWQLVWCLPTQY